MNPILVVALGLFSLLLVMLVLLKAGLRLGARDLARDGEGARAGAVEGAVFGLMALLIAFTFSGAAARFDTRRQLVVEEANDIGTAWLRLDLLPANAQPPLREKFRQYVDARLAVYRKMPDLEAAKAELARCTVLQGEIWNQAVTACKEGPPPAAMLLLPALNQMFDITTTRTMAARMHPPALIYVMLVLLVLAGSLLVGYGLAAAKARNWFHISVYLAVNLLALYVIFDFEFPRFGLIHIGGFDQVMMDLLQSMK